MNIVWEIEGEEEVGSLYLGQFVAQYEDLLKQAYGCVWEAGGKNIRGRYEISLNCKGLLYIELCIREVATCTQPSLTSSATRLDIWCGY
ncbi:MAG: hypothetical protein GY832_27225 [Chloroflexi bacterium]|nr:hypothetical protein [Chloroflexota bacterium]